MEKELYLACVVGDFAAVMSLVDKKQVLSCLNEDGWTPVHVASENGHLDIVKWLVDVKESDPLCRDGDGWTPLHAASENGHLEIVMWLVDEKRADPLCQSEEGWTPLHVASLHGHLDIVRWLVDEKRADPLCQSEEGWTPLHVACQDGYVDIVKWLVDEKQVDPLCQNEEGWTVLHVASVHGHLDIMSWLVDEKQVDPLCQDKNGWTPLHVAFENDHLDIVKWLVEKQANPLHRDDSGISDDGHTAVQYLNSKESISDVYLRGVDVIGETTLSVTNKAQTFHWAGYGLKLHIPPASLPTGVEQSSIVIKASLAGQFQLPENTTLVSAVFWLYCPVKFVKPLTLEIQHCGKHSGALSFVHAKCTQKDLPYQFKPLTRRGVFSPHHCYGSVILSSFSGLGVIQEGSEEQQYYCARLYYFGSKIDWRVHFVVTKDLEASNMLVNQKYIVKGAIEGPDQHIEFEGDEITMDIPEGDSITIGGWTIIALTPPTITKKLVDNYESGRWIPSCQLQIVWTDEQPPVVFRRKVNLHGAKKPFNYITIQSDPLPSGPENVLRSKAASVSIEQARTPGDLGGSRRQQEDATVEEAPVPSLKALSAAVAPVRDWYTLGVQLEVPDHRLDEIEHNHPRNASRCKLEVLRCWLASTPQPSWQSLASALRSMDENSIADSIEARAS